jgi:hypothetical protein
MNLLVNEIIAERRLMNKKNFVIAVFLVITVLIVALEAKASYTPSDKTSTSEDDANKKYEFDWYAVEPWEVDVCSKWGGITAPEESASGQKNILNQLSQDFVMTLQAQKTVTPDKKFVYEVGYYLQPTRLEEQIVYEIIFKRNGLADKSVASATADMYNNFAGYYLEKLDENYTEIIFSYTSQRGSSKHEFEFIDQVTET